MPSSPDPFSQREKGRNERRFNTCSGLACLSTVVKEWAMKISYDKDTNSAYIELSGKTPTGVIEIAEGVNLDTTDANEIVGIEVLEGSKKVPIESLSKYEVNRALADRESSS
jgi:uncharacterized protein YuzE